MYRKVCGLISIAAGFPIDPNNEITFDEIEGCMKVKEELKYVVRLATASLTLRQFDMAQFMCKTPKDFTIPLRNTIWTPSCQPFSNNKLLFQPQFSSPYLCSRRILRASCISSSMMVTRPARTDIVCVDEECDQEGLTCFLKGKEGSRLKPELCFEVSSDLTHKTFKWILAN